MYIQSYDPGIGHKQMGTVLQLSADRKKEKINGYGRIYHEQIKRDRKYN